MSTTNSQRIGIWIIAVVLTIGTIGSFFVVIVANDNNRKDQEEFQKQLAAYQEANKPLPLDGYETTTFDKDSVEELKVDVLKQGSGEELKEDSTITANYFGWTYDGEIFDSTHKGDSTSPIDFSLTQVIEGWTKGLAGQKVGSVVRLTIPGEQAYGNVDDGTGRPYGPLMFIVEIKDKKDA
ncbi:FKBP-type peptidyl-prolyl cis-trans isomerase [Candidatus Saccharibacteria bacterium]|nr:FKBP-type peptidyl-prolyl cis-trans isomerase [Candidatus Saccharibacteria bacterium]